LDDVLHNFAGARAAFLITYLGLPITVNWLRINHLQYVLDWAANKMQGWQANLLNIGGRKELVKTVLSSLPTYLLTAIKPSKKFYKEMDKLRRRFLWAGTQRLHGGKCKVNWQRVCRPMNRGGLGITDLEKFGRALRLRWLWFQWKSPDKAWCGSELPIDQIDEAIFAAATRVTIHSGWTAKFWQSSWIDGFSPAMMFPSLFQHSRRKQRSVKDALHNENWIRDLMHDMTPALLVQYVMLWILRFPSTLRTQPKTKPSGGELLTVTILHDQRMSCNLREASSLLSQPWCCKHGLRLDVIFLPGFFYRTGSGQQIDCCSGNGPTSIFARCLRNLETSGHLF
jgi:hypothetical protein